MDHQALQGGMAGHARRRSEYVQTFLVCQQDKVERDRLLGLALGALACTTKTMGMGEYLHRCSANKGSMGLDRGGPTHKQNMSIFFHCPIHIQQQQPLGSLSIISSLHGMPHSIVSDRGPGLH